MRDNFERNAKARQAHLAWVASLPPEELQRIKVLGLDKYVDPNEKSFACPVQDEIYEQPEQPQEDSIPESHQLSAAQLRHFIGLFVGLKNIAMEIDCFAMVVGLDEMVGAVTQASLAQRHHVTRACINKTVIKWQTILGLGKRPGQYSQEKREIFRQARIRTLTNEK